MQWAFEANKFSIWNLLYSAEDAIEEEKIKVLIAQRCNAHAILLQNENELTIIKVMKW